jgi:hypothetical protein
MDTVWKLQGSTSSRYMPILPYVDRTRKSTKLVVIPGSDEEFLFTTETRRHRESRVSPFLSNEFGIKQSR